MKMQDPIILDPASIVRIDVRANTDEELRAICRKIDVDAAVVIELRDELAILYLRLSDRMLIAGCFTLEPRAIFFDDAFIPMPRSVKEAIVAIPPYQPPAPEPPRDEEAELESLFELMEYDVDGLLDKISTSGFDALDEWELAFLDRRTR